MAAGTARLDPKSATMLQEAYRHHKTVAAWGSGVESLATAVDVLGAGVITGEKATKPFTDALIDALGWPTGSSLVRSLRARRRAGLPGG